MRRLRVLVADDEPGICLTIQVLMERRGHEVLLAANVADARSLLSRECFDVCLFDLRLPGNGLVLAREAESKHELQGRVLLMSGGDAPSGGEYADRFIEKPFDYDELISRIEAAADPV